MLLLTNRPTLFKLPDLVDRGSLYIQFLKYLSFVALLGPLKLFLRSINMIKAKP